MNSKALFIFGSMVGGVIGAVVSYAVVDNKKKNEIEEIKQSYERYFSKSINKVVEDEEDKIKEEYNKKIYSLSYAQPEETIAPVEPSSEPYYISPEQYSEEHIEYAKETLVYYDENEVLLNDKEECVDAGSTIGFDFINHIGEYEKDATFVRNDALGVDYEVLVEHSTFNGGE